MLEFCFVFLETHTATLAWESGERAQSLMWAHMPTHTLSVFTLSKGCHSQFSFVTNSCLEHVKCWNFVCFKVHFWPQFRMHHSEAPFPCCYPSLEKKTTKKVCLYLDTLSLEASVIGGPRRPLYIKAWKIK